MIITAIYFHVINLNTSFLIAREALIKWGCDRECTFRMQGLKFLLNIGILRQIQFTKRAIKKFVVTCPPVNGSIEMMRMHSCDIKTSGIQISLVVRWTTRNGNLKVDSKEMTRMTIPTKALLRDPAMDVSKEFPAATDSKTLEL